MLIFSGIAAAAVWLAGWRDAARDPRLTTVCLALLAIFPLLGAWLPKLPLLPAATAALGGSGEAGLGWLRLLGVVWAGGFAVAMMRLLLALRGIARWRARSEHVAWVSGVEIRTLDGLRGPVAAGVWRRFVLVPGDWHEWTASARQMVLAHELTHHRRCDPLCRWVAELCVRGQLVQSRGCLDGAAPGHAKRVCLRCRSRARRRGGQDLRALVMRLCRGASPARIAAGHGRRPRAGVPRAAFGPTCRTAEWLGGGLFHRPHACRCGNPGGARPRAPSKPNTRRSVHAARSCDEMVRQTLPGRPLSHNI